MRVQLTAPLATTAPIAFTPPAAGLPGTGPPISGR